MNQLPTNVRIVRVVLVVALFILPLAGPGSLGVLLAAIAATVAYHGIRRGTIYGMLAVLIGVELLYGLDIGVLSLSYVVAVLVLAGASRVFSVAPWTSSGGWNLADGLRVFIVASGLFALMTASGVVTGHVLYGYAEMRARLGAAFLTYGTAWMPALIAVVLVVLRRIDEPFRRRITFGT